MILDIRRISYEIAQETGAMNCANCGSGQCNGGGGGTPCGGGGN